MQLANLTQAAPSRLTPYRRVLTRIGYQWRNGGHLVASGRVQWDTRSWRSIPMVRSEKGGLTISYCGLPEGLAYTLEFTEERRTHGNDEPATRHVSTMRGRDLLSATCLPDADIQIVGTSAEKAWRLPSASSLVIPMRVHFVIDFDEPVENVIARASWGARRDFRQQSRKAEWGFGIEADPQWFDYFYERIYRATMYQRYGPHARTEGKEAAYECLFRHGILFHLTKDGQRVAGHLCHWNPTSGVLTSRLLGVLDGSPALYAAGALKVMYFQLIEWAGRNGVRQLDLQGTEPFLSKGTYQLKRKLGSRVVLPPNHFGRKRLWIQIRRDTPQVRDFLVDNPVLAEDIQGRLEAVYFCDDSRPAKADTYQARSPGIGGVRHLSLDEFLGSGESPPARTTP